MSNLTNEINPWEAYKKAIQSKFPSILNQLNAPATDEQITELEAKIGLLLPEQFKQLYKINNGEKQEKLCGILLGFHLYSLEDILREWTAWKEVREELSEADLLEAKRIRISRYCILGVAVLFLVYGLATGGIADVLAKAINICTECIGLG